MNWDAWPNFEEHEFACKCGCGKADMEPGFMNFLQYMRDDFGMPMFVSSGFRCREHNAEVSETGFDGPHTTGKAVDISVSGVSAHTLLSLAFRYGVEGIGIHQRGKKRFIHLDMITEGTRPWVWSY